jgi:hypothetical protein
MDKYDLLTLVLWAFALLLLLAIPALILGGA